ncbi:DJ-1/PfpI family protein [Amycolatopsis jejuensis]|uniref:DJ-1/PfpI family protein n=1 Tax=Amycolatopsis jejuensis TaxID=330084 RepID=UPI0005267D86|nr:DJ-1/PfpI family protein [Amycolatopsis jejuensis]
MQVAFVLFPGLTVLDMMGPFEVLAFVPGVETVLVAEKPGPVVSEKDSLVLQAGAGFAEVTRPDVVVVPGGPGQADQMADGPLHQWLRSVDRTATWTTSVCTGSLILAAAGLLQGRRATTHWLAKDQLPQFGVTPATERVVFDGHYVTAAGVSSGIDMALTLVGRIAGDRAAQSRQLSIEYAPEPPYDAGSPETAPVEVVADLVRRRDEILKPRAT